MTAYNEVHHELEAVYQLLNGIHSRTLKAKEKGKLSDKQMKALQELTKDLKARIDSFESVFGQAH